MQIFALFIIIVSLIAIAYRDLKTALLSLLFILMIALAFYFFSPKQQISPEFISNIELRESDIAIGYAQGFVLNTRIHNQHETEALHNFLIRSSLLDCDGDGDQTQCLTLGEEENLVKLRIPPLQARDVNINLRIKLLNPVRGKAVWKHEVVGVGVAVK